MAQHEEIVLWLDRRWKNAIEKHLKGETLQEHLETVLDELCNRLPEREYERISRAIQSEAAAQRAEEEAARTYAAYHVVENGQEWYYKTTPGEELLAVGKKLRGYVTKGSGCLLYTSGARTMNANNRTIAFQVPEELFGRLKDYLARNGLKQKDFILGLIERELKDAGNEE